LLALLFSFDDVLLANGVEGWSAISRRDAISQVSAEETVREMEALNAAAR